MPPGRPPLFWIAAALVLAALHVLSWSVPETPAPQPVIDTAGRLAAQRAELETELGDLAAILDREIVAGGSYSRGLP